MTHHGTPLKTHGPGPARTPVAAAAHGLRRRCCAAARAGTTASRSNAFSTLVWERVYPTRYESLETGYPRNDVLATATARGRASGSARELGIEPGQTAVLYAPTHREYQRRATCRRSTSRGSPTASGPTTCSWRAALLLRRRPRCASCSRAAASRDVARPSLGRGALPGRRRAASPTTPRSCSTTPCSTARSSSTRPTGRSTATLRGTYFDLMAEPPGRGRRARRTSWSTRFALGRRRAGERAGRLRAAFRARFCALEDGRAAERVVRRVWLGERDVARSPSRWLEAMSGRQRRRRPRRRRRPQRHEPARRDPRPARLPHPAARGDGRRHEPARLRRAALGRRLPHQAACGPRRVTVNDSRPAAWEHDRGAPRRTRRSWPSCAPGWRQLAAGRRGRRQGPARSAGSCRCGSAARTSWARGRRS